MDVGQLDECRLLRDEEYVFFEHEQVALDGFEVSLDAWVTVPALEAACANDLACGQCTEDTGHDLEGRVVVSLLQSVVFGNLLSLEVSV